MMIFPRALVCRPTQLRYVSYVIIHWLVLLLLMTTTSSCECAETRKSENETVRFLRILIAPAAVFGTSFAFALQMVFLTPIMTGMGVSKSAVSLVWLVGPLAGLVVQPVVGIVSDEFHRRHATRLPLVLAASAILVASHAAIACSEFVSKCLGMSSLWVFVIGFLILDSANNAILVTTRAMLSDRFAREHRTFAFSVLQFWTSFGYILGYLVATGGDATSSSSTTAISNKVFVCFSISGLMVIGSTLLSFLSVYEKRACRAKFHGPHTGESFCIGGLFINPSIVSVTAGSILTWFGWFAQQIYQTDFISEEVIPGTAAGTAALQGLGGDGMQISAMGLLISSILSCISGLLLPVLLSYIGYDSVTLFRVWSVSTLFQSLVLLSSLLVRTVVGAVVWEATTGPMFAIACTVPYMLVANNCDHGCSGRVMAFVNVAVCLPQLLVSLLGGVLVKIANTDIVLFVMGGVFCLMATWLLWVPEGFEAPPWSEGSYASLMASSSDIFSPMPSIIEQIRAKQHENGYEEIRLRGLSTPKLPNLEPSLSFPLLYNEVGGQP